MNLLVFDFGAGSGRAILFKDAEKKLAAEEIYRFKNITKIFDGVLCWDVFDIFQHMLKALDKAAKVCKIDSIGIDTWGVDYVVVSGDADKDLQNLQETRAVHYRDNCSQKAKKLCDGLVPQAERWQRTGTAQHAFNTLYRLAYCKPQDTVQFMPDYFAYLLTGVVATEWTAASTGEILSCAKPIYDTELCSWLKIDTSVFAPIVKPCTFRGELLKSVKARCGIEYDVQVVNVCSHDTACAVAAVPTKNQRFAYISSGTWSLMGTELALPVLSAQAYREGFTNEIGVGGSVRFLKNIMGMWIIMQLKADFEKRYQKEITFQGIVEQAQKFEEFGLFDANDESLYNPISMTDAIQSLLRKNGQSLYDDIGYLAKSAYVNLSLEYALTLQKLSALTQKTYDCLYVVGGGSNNDFLNQLTADAAGIPVYAGIPEATAYGNALCQLIAHGSTDIEKGRQLIGASFDLKAFYPKHKLPIEQYALIKEKETRS